MLVDLVCPGCHHRSRVNDRAALMGVRCIQCRSLLRAPERDLRKATTKQRSGFLGLLGTVAETVAEEAVPEIVAEIIGSLMDS